MHKNKINGKIYIGQSCNLNVRWHPISYKDCSYFYNAIQKYGWDNFEHVILEDSLSIEEADQKEKYYIEKYNTLNRDYGYNLKSGGQNGGSQYTDSVRKKMSESTKKSYTQELINKRKSDALKQWSDENFKKSRCGKNASMYGHHHTEEAKKKMSEAKKGSVSYKRNHTPVFCIELNQEYTDATTASKELSIDSCGILKVCRNERKTCGGYHWKFINRENKVS